MQNTQNTQIAITDWDQVPGWHHLPAATQQRIKLNFSVQEFATQLTGGVLTDKITLRFEEDGKLLFAAEAPELYIRRDFSFAWNSGHLSRLALPVHMQGNGLGRAILRNTIRVADKLGFRQLAMDASDIGSYVWAKAGFLPWGVSGNWFSALRKRELRDSNIRPLVENLVYHNKGLWELADYVEGGVKLGKSFLPGKAWNGYFHVDNTIQMDRLESYCTSS